VVIQRGDIRWVYLPQPEGSEPGYQRPVVIVQSDSFNQSRIETVLGVALTTNLRLADAPGNVRLPSRQTGLPRDCIAHVSQLITMNKTALGERVGPLPAGLMRKVEDGLRMVLEL